MATVTSGENRQLIEYNENNSLKKRTEKMRRQSRLVFSVFYH